MTHDQIVPSEVTEMARRQAATVDNAMLGVARASLEAEDTLLELLDSTHGDNKHAVKAILDALGEWHEATRKFLLAEHLRVRQK